jgi:antitoxin CptB
MDAEYREQKARLYWQCRRGMRELDLLLQEFLDHGWSGLSPPARAAFVRMLDYPDALLLEYLMGRRVPSDREVADVVVRIRSPAAG